MNKVTTGIVVTALAAVSAEAQEPTATRCATSCLRCATGLGHFTDDVLFGEVWLRKELAPRDRSIVTICGTDLDRKSPAGCWAYASRFNNGVTPAEIGEVITDLALHRAGRTRFRL